MSDKRISVCDEYLAVDYFEAEVLAAMDYYPFGMMMPDRQWYANSDSSAYRFGFNGMERDNEVSGQGNNLDFGARIYDARLGRWLSVDPLQNRYTSISSFTFVLNNPIRLLDPNGMEVKIERGKGVSKREHRRMVRQIWFNRIFSKSYRTMYKELKNSEEVYIIRSDHKGEEYKGIYEHEVHTIIINLDVLKDKWSLRGTIAHETGHAWRRKNGLDESPELPELPKPVFPKLFEKPEEFQKRKKAYYSEFDQVMGERSQLIAASFKRKELGARHIENIVMSELGRKFIFSKQKTRPILTYPTFVAEQYITPHGNISYQLVPGEIRLPYKSEYYDKKRNIEVEGKKSF